MERLPPCESIAAVSAATPSFPAGSDAEPTLNRIRKLTRGDDLCKRRSAILGALFPPSANTKAGDMIAVSRTGQIHFRILPLLLVGQGHDGSMLGDEILAGHRLQVIGRDRCIKVIQLIHCFRRAAERNVGSKA